MLTVRIHFLAWIFLLWAAPLALAQEAPDPRAPSDAELRRAAITSLQQAIATIDQADLSDRAADGQRMQLVLDLVRIGATDEAQGALEAMDDRPREMTIDYLYKHASRREPAFRSAWVLEQVVDTPNSARRVARLMGLAGISDHGEPDGFMEGYIAHEFNNHQIDDLDNLAFDRLLRAVEATGLPEEGERIYSAWVNRNSNTELGRAPNAGVDSYPGANGVYHGLAWGALYRGDPDAALEWAGRIEEDGRYLCRTYREIAMYQHLRGDSDGALASLRLALTAAEEEEERPTDRIGIARQLAAYGDSEAGRQILVHHCESVLAQAGQDPEGIEDALRGIDWVCPILREIGGDEAVNEVLESAAELVDTLPQDAQVRFRWPQLAASRALVAGDPATAMWLVRVMPAHHRRVEMMREVLTGWVRAGDAREARKAYDALMADIDLCTEASRRGAWKNSVRDAYEPWIAQLEAGEAIPQVLTADECYRAMLAFCQQGRFDEARASIEAHSPVDAIRFKHLLILAEFLAPAGETDRLRDVLAQAHQLASSGDLLKREEEAPDGPPAFYLLDNRVWHTHPSDPPARPMVRTWSLPHPVFGSAPARQGGGLGGRPAGGLGGGRPGLGGGDTPTEPNSRAAEIRAVSAMSDVFQLQLRWGLIDDAIGVLQDNDRPLLTTYAALFVVEANRGHFENRGRNGMVRQHLPTPELVDTFTQALLVACEPLDDEVRLRVAIGLGEVPTDHPEAAQRIIELIPGMRRKYQDERDDPQHRGDAPSRLDQATIDYCTEAFEHGALGRFDEMTRAIDAAAARADDQQDPLSRACMLRVIGGIELTFGMEDRAGATLALGRDALAGYLNEEGAGVVGTSNSGIGSRVADDMLAWGVVLGLDRDERLTVGILNEQTRGPLEQALADASRNEPNGDPYLEEVRLAIVTPYLAQPQNLPIVWDIIMAIDKPWLSHELLPYISGEYARHDPAGWDAKLDEIEGANLRWRALAAGAQRLAGEAARQ